MIRPTTPYLVCFTGKWGCARRAWSVLTSTYTSSHIPNKYPTTYSSSSGGSALYLDSTAATYIRTSDQFGVLLYFSSYKYVLSSGEAPPPILVVVYWQYLPRIRVEISRKLCKQSQSAERTLAPIRVLILRNRKAGPGPGYLSFFEKGSGTCYDMLMFV